MIYNWKKNTPAHKLITKINKNTFENIDRQYQHLALEYSENAEELNNEVIDTSKGEKLERWGDYLLVRPDPQVIWDTPRKHPGWRKMNGHYHRSKKGDCQISGFGM